MFYARWSFSAGTNWLLFYLFSRHHCLPDSVEFLSDCAIHEDWITLLVFAELFQCTPSKVRMCRNDCSLQRHFAFDDILWHSGDTRKQVAMLSEIGLKN